jgi:cardiolipin synthase
MFSVKARARMMEKGPSLSSFFGFFVDSVRESVENIRANPTLFRGVVGFSSIFHVVALAALFPLYYWYRDPSQLGLFVYDLCFFSILSYVGFTGWLSMNVGLIRDGNGRLRPTVGLANYLTMARFYLIVPIVLLFSHDFHAEALALYVVLGLTDIADGVVARARREQTEFGVVMDPLADVFSTAAVFATFLAHGLIPAWLFLILMLRYGMLIVGSFVVFLATGPIQFRGTIPGKIVGVLQGIGIIIIVWCVWRGLEWEQDIAPVLFPLLGLVFATIVLSQAINGYRHLKRYSALKNKAVNVGS